MSAAPATQTAPPEGEPGLTSEQARALLARHGPNRPVPEHRRPTFLAWVLKALADPMAILLLVAGATYLLLRDFPDAAVTLVALVPITAVTLVLDARSEHALDELKRLTAPTAAVWRDGHQQVVAAEAVVPGDLVILHEGDIVPADGELVQGAQLVLDESALTGESQPVVKDAGAAGAEREVYAGTTLLSNRGIARVTATGPATRYGLIGALVARIRQPSTPLQRLIRRLVAQLAFVAGAFCVAVVAVELARGHDLAAAIIAGVSLAIAAIPEEFPMVYTLYLSLGAWRLTRDRALIRRLAGVETLGATTVICSDKTGTLTLGRVEVAEIATAPRFRGGGPAAARSGDSAGPHEQELLEAAALACEPHPFDPLEQAVLRYAEAQGVDVAALHGSELLHDYPFDPALKYMSHVWRRDRAARTCAKGALEGILERSHATAEVRDRALEANRTLASQGMRVLAVAAGDLARLAGRRDEDEATLRFLGLIAFSDPPRPGVADALGECAAAGIRVIMITGDHPLTAHAIADELGIEHDADGIATGDEIDALDDAQLGGLVASANVFARTRPEQKYRLVRTLRAGGHVVAMTGDGINDAPALREADIGVAMGQRGTEVAREAATLVLLDDNFATIVAAVKDGRRIFDNLRRAFSYLIAFHIPLLLAALVVPLVGSPLLLLPAHLVWLELIVHPMASLVFEADPPSPELMRRPPRPRGVGLLTRLDWLRPLAEGLTLFGGVLALYLVRLAQDVPTDRARALALVAMILGQTALVLAERAPDRPFWRISARGNWALPAVAAATLLSLPAALYIPGLSGLLKLQPLAPAEWAVAGVVGVVAALWLEPLKLWRAA